MIRRPAIETVEAFCYRFPLETPVVTSFGRMTDRPAVFVRLMDEAGVQGWGEVWCNFPSPGAEHRARLVREVLAPAVISRVEAEGEDSGGAESLFGRLQAQFAVLALQSGEFGPFAQAAAGLDSAHWDLFAQRAGRPLWRMLGGTEPTLPVYASGINPGSCAEMAERALAAGHRAFKLKVGFGPETDRRNLARLREVIGDRTLAADANQGWSPGEAPARVAELAPFGLEWLEEPVRADVPWADWRPMLRPGGPVLAGGENIVGEGAFAEAFRAGVLGVIQPDLAKWGGVSLCARVARAAVAAGRRFCPHYLGGGVGLLASAHLLAGVGGGGMLEIDANENGLREAGCGPVGLVADGLVTLGEAPGLGAAPDLDALEIWRTA